MRRPTLAPHFTLLFAERRMLAEVLLPSARRQADGGILRGGSGHRLGNEASRHSGLLLT